MKIRIEPCSQLPVYVQMREQIKFLILSGELEPGTRLPTASELAGYLSVHRNTVLKAYQELVREGLIEAQRGAGCTVLEDPAGIPRSVFSRLVVVIDDAIEQACELGVGPDEFAALARARARQRQDLQPRRRLILVECTPEGADALAHRIEDRLDVDVTPVVLRDLGQPTPELEELLQDVDVIATTFFHIEKVGKLLPTMKKKLVALSVKPHLSSLVEIAAIPQGTRVLLVCLGESGASDMKRALEDAGIKGLDFSLCGADDPQSLAALVPEHAVVVASDLAASEVLPLLQPDQRSILLDYTTLDEGAAYLLRSVLGEEAPRT
ncbi:MAG: GntR family transcriptional regulator [Anaerolineae bacterium]|nr:GntR family transcriptional regulator [Anaerolineae bacterium]NIN99274.1 GntR family transcriptional regulator [Anaerolineae bacterium]NIQ82113.1 GntR family transcriptional regulator [Anaerolineae bacterium]